MNHIRRILTCLFILLLTSCLAFAQVETARITGTVTDSTGAVIPGTMITFVHVATNTTFEMQADEVGRYVSPPLRIGEYRVELVSEGFKKAVRTGVHLEINETAVLNTVMELGAVSEVVDVTADAPLLETTQATAGQVIDNKRIVDLPLNGRDYIQLALLSQGAVQGLGGRFGGFSAGGNRTTQNNYMLDGVDNNNVQIAAQGRQAESVKPSIDAVQEFKVSTNSFSAEYGRAMGGVVNVSLKSGSNDFHGTAFEFVRNDKIDAKNLFDAADADKPPFKRNQFGFSAGGPIVKNKLFIFGDYEWTKIRESRTVTTTIPTPLMRSGNFSEISKTIYDPYSYNGTERSPFPNNTIPTASQDPISREIASWYPDPNKPGLTVNHLFNPPNSSDVDKWDIRTDYNLSSNDTLYFRFSYQRQFDPPSPALPFPAYDSSANGSPFEHNGRNMAMVWNHVWNPSLITSTRLGWNKMFTERQSPVDNAINAELGIQGVNQALAGMATMNITGYQNIGTGSFTPNLADSQARQLVSDTTWTRGAHSIKFGINFTFLQSYLSNPQQELGVFYFNKNYTRNPKGNAGGDGFADFMTGVSFRGDVSTSVYMNLRAPWYQAYIHDEWRVNRRLTLNIGLRGEFNNQWVEKDDMFSMWDIHTNPNNPDWVFPVSGGSRNERAMIDNDFKLAPRFGFAYKLFDNTVLRGGYGVFVANYEGTGGGQYLETNPPFHIKVRQSTNSKDISIRLQDGMDPEILTPEKARSVSLSIFERKPTMPIAQQWNLNVQQQFGQNWVWEFGYYGNKANHLVRRYDDNYAPPMAGNIDNNRRYKSLVWPNSDVTISPLGSMNSHHFNGNSLYHGFQTRLEKRFADGFTFWTNFAWSKTIGDTNGFSGSGNTANSGPQNTMNLRLERSLADQHMGKRLVTSFIYELPFGSAKKFGSSWSSVTNAVLGGWSVTGISTLTDGQPAGFSVSGNNTNGSGGQRPNAVAGQSWQLSRSERTIERWFNTDALVANNQYEYGNVGRNTFIRPRPRQLRPGGVQAVQLHGALSLAVAV